MPFCFVFIIIESLALRPAYPVIITCAALVNNLGLIFFSHNHPGATWFGDPVEILTGQIVSLWGVVHAMIFLLIGGSTLTWLMCGVRKTVIQAAELEAERFEVIREQKTTSNQDKYIHFKLRLLLLSLIITPSEFLF